jgi:hypothetical protein
MRQAGVSVPLDSRMAAARSASYGRLHQQPAMANPLSVAEFRAVSRERSRQQTTEEIMTDAEIREMTDSEGGSMSFFCSLIAKIMGAEEVVILARDNKQELSVGSRGFPNSSRMIAMLRFVARHIENAERGTPDPDAPPVVNRAKMQPAGKCPACDVSMYFPPDLPVPIPDSAALVCTCGAFLKPCHDETGTLGARLMNADEIFAMPDDMRNNMLRYRRVLAEIDRE